MSHLSMLHLSPATAAALPATLAALPLPALLAYSVELFMLLSHAQVLLGVGPSHSYEALKRRRYYFVFDLLSPWAALTAAPGDPPPAMILMCLLHAALHVYYIVTWDTPHTDRVIRLASDDAPPAKRFQGGKYGGAELAWYHAGTAFDMATHAALLWLLTGAGAKAP